MNKKNKKGRIALVTALVIVSILVVSIVMAAPRAKKACSDGQDNDGDGYTDWPSDPGCANRNDISELNPNVECDDGIDNDGDSATDMSDGGCSNPIDNDETNCGDGVCEGVETSGNCPQDCGFPDSCSDTDTGNIISIFGTVSGYYDRQYYSNSDYCVDASQIMEYYCNGVLKVSQQQSCGTDGYVGDNYCLSGDVYRDYKDYYCSSGVCSSTTTPTLQQDCVAGQYCSNGACYQYDSCSDTDYGFYPNVQGTASGYYNQQPYSKTDYCVDLITVMEYYCGGSIAYNWTANCNTGNSTTMCSNGACI